MLFAGSSGYSFKEWVGNFYPPKTSSKNFLAYYASELNSVEINYTFRRFPKMELIDSWAEATPEDFKFSVKMHRSVTHMARLKAVSQSVEDFIEALVPLGVRLGAVLFQCPPFFKLDLERLDTFLSELPSGHRYALEFRHESWNDATVVDRLKEAGVALCAAEVEIGETEFTRTAPFAYLRLRKPPPYTDDEISKVYRLLERISGEVEDTYLYVKHDDEGLAPESVKKIVGLAGSG